MTNQLAVILGATLLTAILGDFVLNDGEALLFLSRKFFLLLDWVAFWR
jgi:hypothetical protein